MFGFKSIVGDSSSSSLCCCCGCCCRVASSPKSIPFWRMRASDNLSFREKGEDNISLSHNSMLLLLLLPPAKALVVNHNNHNSVHTTTNRNITSVCVCGRVWILAMARLNTSLLVNRQLIILASNRRYDSLGGRRRRRRYDACRYHFGKFGFVQKMCPRIHFSIVALRNVGVFGPCGQGQPNPSLWQL